MVLCNPDWPRFVVITHVPIKNYGLEETIIYQVTNVSALVFNAVALTLRSRASK